MSQFPGLREHGQLIDQLRDLEAEAIAKDASWRTLEAIRATWLKLRIERAGCRDYRPSEASERG